MEIAKELGSVANEINVPVDMRKGKNENEKINGWEIVIM